MMGILLCAQLLVGDVSVENAPIDLVAKQTRRDVFSDSPAPEAPAKPQPWAKSPFIFIFQFVGAVGARTLVLPLMLVPVVGPPVAVLLMPVAEAVAVTWVGDHMGDGRAPLVPSLLTSVALGGVGAAVAVASGTGLLALGMAAVLLVLPGAPLVGALLAVSVPVLAGVMTLAGAALVAVGVVATVMTVLSPVASVAVYQGLKHRKPRGDNGSGGFSLFTRPAEEAPQPPPVEKKP